MILRINYECKHHKFTKKIVLCSFKVIYLGQPKEGLKKVFVNFHFMRGYSPPLINSIKYVSGPRTKHCRNNKRIIIKILTNIIKGNLNLDSREKVFNS